jgi:site-specific DNA recombinase
MKVALYARVSTQRQEKQGTIASQVAALRRYAQEHHHIVAEEYVCKDDGYSGSLLARPELDRLRDGAEAGAFDAVLVLSPDRLSRKYAYLILILEEFECFGTEVVFLEQSPGDDPHSTLLVQIQGAVAEYERAKLAERYRRGKLHRARQGEVFWTNIPYGYRRIARRDNVAAHLVINESEAEVVRRIFTWHADEGITIRQITKRLTREGYPTPKGGKQWGETTVHRILRREDYLGILYYNKSYEESVPVSEQNPTGKRRNQKPRSEWIPVSIPSIIDRETFERSQTRHEPNQQFSPRNLHEEHWLLRRLVRCEKCCLKCACVADRRRPHMPPSYYYRCEKQDRVPGRPRCRPNHIRAEPLDELVWHKIRSHLLNPELLLKAHATVNDMQCMDQSFLATQIQNARKRVEKLSVQRRRLIDVFQEGFILKEEFEERMAVLSKRIDEIKSDLVNLEMEYKNASDGKQMLSRINDFTSTVTKNIDRMSFFQKQKLVRTIIHEVVIHDNVVKIYFKIPLPKLKNDASKSKKIYNGTQSENKVSSESILRSRCGDGGGLGPQPHLAPAAGLGPRRAPQTLRDRGLPLPAHEGTAEPGAHGTDLFLAAYGLQCPYRRDHRNE